MRQEQEKKGSKDFPGWEALEGERMEDKPRVWIVVKDNAGNVIRRVDAMAKKGFHRVAWDLRYPAPDAIAMKEPPPPMWGGPPKGMMAAPGTYTATLFQQVNGKVTELSKPQTFEVVPLREGALQGAPTEEVVAFWRAYEDAVRTHSVVQMSLGNALTKVERMKKVMAHSRASSTEFDQRLSDLRMALLKIDQNLNGNKSKMQPGEKTNPTIGSRLFTLSIGIGNSTYGPTTNHKRGLEIINKQMSSVQADLEKNVAALSALAKDLVKAGGPWMEGE